VNIWASSFNETIASNKTTAAILKKEAIFIIAIPDL
jgi:hypothetical protein